MSELVRPVFICILVAVAPATAQQPSPPLNNGGLPYASPDGRWIAFHSNRDGTPDLYVIRTDGSGLRRITTGADREGVAGWSADSKEIIFTLSKAGVGPMTPGATVILQSAGLEGGPIRELGEIPGRGVAVSRDQRLIAWSGGRPQASIGVISRADGSAAKFFGDTTKAAAFNFAWSPDGSVVAYTSMTLTTPRELSIWTIKPDGSGARQLAAVDTTEGTAQWPAWSPDGKRIAVQVGKYDRNDPTKSSAHIWLIDVATGASRKIAAHNPGYLDETPSWIDNDTITFQSNRTGRMEIWVMKADGSGARQITK